MYKNWRGKGTRYVIHPVLVETSNKGETSHTANTTTDFYITATPNRTASIERITAACSTIAVDADGSSTAVVSRVRNGTDVQALNTAFNIGTMTALVTSTVTMDALTDAQRTHKSGDVYRVRLTNSSAAIDTQPVDLNFAVELNLLD